MPRIVRHDNTEAVNSDSFLDIVASVVSIMIIMVVMEGVRIKNAPVTVSVPASSENEEVRNAVAEEQSTRRDLEKAAEDLEKIRRATVPVAMSRDSLATTVAVVEQTIQEYRKDLDGAKQAEFDLARNLSESKQQLDQLKQQREQAEQETSAPVVIESYPTPISHAVDGPEAHLLISNGRVVFIPLEPLLEQLKQSAQRRMRDLINQPEVVDTVGPVGDFRLKYTLERHDVNPDPSTKTRGGSYARLEKWSLIPTSNDIGEPVRLALAEESDFNRTLAKILPGRTTITIWVYPDGFEAFRQIRKELYRRNYAIAARPLPTGQQISGSPDGSKSAAQ
jgi:hypothetical protein